MKPEQEWTADWAAMIEQLVAKGIPLNTIGEAMGSALTDRMVRAYRLGEHPRHWRGEALIEFWCREMRKKRKDVPRLVGMVP